VKARAEKPMEKSCFYLLDDKQNADLESYRYALRALSQLACQSDGEEKDAIINRFNLRCLFDQLEKRLADIICDGNLESEWLERPSTIHVKTFQ